MGRAIPIWADSRRATGRLRYALFRIPSV